MGDFEIKERKVEIVNISAPILCAKKKKQQTFQPNPYLAAFLSPAVVGVSAGVSCRPYPALVGSPWRTQPRGPTLSSPQQLPARLEPTQYEVCSM